MMPPKPTVADVNTLVTAWQPTVLPDPTPLSKITPAQALARWLVLVWERPGGEGGLCVAIQAEFKKRLLIAASQSGEET